MIAPPDQQNPGKDDVVGIQVDLVGVSSMCGKQLFENKHVTQLDHVLGIILTT